MLQKPGQALVVWTSLARVRLFSLVRKIKYIWFNCEENEPVPMHYAGAMVRTPTQASPDLESQPCHVMIELKQEPLGS